MDKRSSSILEGLSGVRVARINEGKDEEKASSWLQKKGKDFFVKDKKMDASGLAKMFKDASVKGNNYKGIEDFLNYNLENNPDCVLK